MQRSKSWCKISIRKPTAIVKNRRIIFFNIILDDKKHSEQIQESLADLYTPLATILDYQRTRFSRATH